MQFHPAQFIKATLLACGMVTFNARYVSAQAKPSVVESTTPQWTARTAWKVDATPLIILGTSETLLSSVASAHRYDDGRIVVGDSAAKEMSMFDAKGKFVRMVARSGSGPGEFSAFASFMSAGGDSLAIYDWRARRTSIFGTQREFLRSIRAIVSAGTTAQGLKFTTSAAPLGLFSNGTMLGQRRKMNREQKQVSRIISDSTGYFVLRDDTMQPIGDFFVNESWEYWHLNGDISFGDAPFARVSAVAVAPEAFFYTAGAQFEITEYNRAGSPVRLLRIRRALAPVNAAHIAEYKANFGDTRGQHKVDVLKWMPFPKTLPTYTRLVRDSDGRMWAGIYDVNPARVRYDVFDASGRWMGTVPLPDNSKLLEANKDWVLLRVLSADGEPLVQLHRVIRPG